MSQSNGGTSGSAQPMSHLQRLSQRLLIGGVATLAIAFVVQEVQYSGHFPANGGFDQGITAALFAQLLTILGTVALTGAAFGYLLAAMRRDSAERSSADVGTADVDGLE